MRAALIILGIVTAAVVGAAAAERALPPPDQARAEIERYVTEVLTDADGRLVYPARHAAMLAQLDDLVAWSLEAGLDPLLVVFIAFQESSLRPDVVGWKRGERGYMQVHGRATTRGYDLRRPDHQWAVGIARLRAAFAACGWDLCRAITNYGTGRCGAYTDRGRAKMRARCRRFQRMRARYRGAP